MSENKGKTTENKDKKSPQALREEEILKFWQENKIFEETIEKPSPKGDFVFYEGPPTANGKPGIHHLEARAFKDAIPRYKTMQGYHVRRKGGWDTHGLPVELEVEKKLGLRSKKEIEKYGIAEFNKKCRQSVLEYIDEWGKFTNRIAYWADFKNPYFTYDSSFMESLWSIIKKVENQGLLYKSYKVVPWCSRCGTALSSHELAQGYQNVKDLSVTVKFKVKPTQKLLDLGIGQDVYILAWTTTPWTLPGNVALAVGSDISYIAVQYESGKYYIVAKDRVSALGLSDINLGLEFKGRNLVGLEYVPPYDYLEDSIEAFKLPGGDKAFRVYSADFVTTEDGTGIVHTAVMYGQDDFVLGTEVGLPKFHLVDEAGNFKTIQKKQNGKESNTSFLSGRFVKDEETSVEIIKDLGHPHRGLLFKKEKYEHSYPFCWRCKTPLIYYARDSWYIKMSDAAVKEKLISENESINWEPAHIKEGRFGEWLSGIKDWAISRERYWGTPLPVWESEDKRERFVVGSIDDLKKNTKKSGNTYFVMRHGEAENITLDIATSNYTKDDHYHLTDKGREEVEKASAWIKEQNFDLIISSPLLRTKETAEIVAEKTGLSKDQIIFNDLIREINTGDFHNKRNSDYHAYFGSLLEKFTKRPPHGENLTDLKRRVMEFLYEIEEKYQNKKILIVSHEYSIWMMFTGTHGWSDKVSAEDKSKKDDFIKTAEVLALPFVPLPHNENYEIDLHKPFIDDVVLEKDGKIFRRTPEVLDVWFDSGGVPFAQDHYLFDESGSINIKSYPADYISEAIDQTRGWFYTLHAIGVLSGYGKAFKNVICLGHLLDKDGKKMSKSVGNVVEPWGMIEKYGVDVLRFWMYSVNGAGDSKNFDEKTVTEVASKVIGRLNNVYSFYDLYRKDEVGGNGSENILDKWIITRLNSVIREVTSGLDLYKLDTATRPLILFIDDLSTWYLRRSRDRFKSDNESEKNSAMQTTGFVLEELSKLLAPFTPFIAEDLYQKVTRGKKEKSVHLESWPTFNPDTEEANKILWMSTTRKIVSDALEIRARVGIKVRQPLQVLKVKGETLKDDYYIELIKDEVNVRNVIFDQELSSQVELNIEITPELKREGDAREVIRAIQDARKEHNLVPSDRIKVTLHASEEVLEAVKDWQDEIKKTTNTETLENKSGEFKVSIHKI